jgi:transcriptional regulator with XRE-family HTH domain
MIGGNVMPMQRGRSRGSVPVNGPALRYVRKSRGLTVAGLAEKIGATQGYISLVELGQRPRVSRAAFDQLTAVLDVDPRVLEVQVREVVASEAAA